MTAASACLPAFWLDCAQDRSEAVETQRDSQIPWLRVFVEGVVIVGSILLAFGT